MSNIHHACDCPALRPPRRAPMRWSAVLGLIAFLLEVFQEALAMRRAAHHKFPFDEE